MADNPKREFELGLLNDASSAITADGIRIGQRPVWSRIQTFGVDFEKILASTNFILDTSLILKLNHPYSSSYVSMNLEWNCANVYL